MATTKIKRNKPFIRHWIKALRSGKYVQTTGVLRRLDPEPEFSVPAGYCCLGVACAISSKIEGRVLRDNYEFRFIQDHKGNSWQDASLPYSMLDYIGITVEEQEILANMNDEDFANFNEIADQLEQWIA